MKLRCTKNSIRIRIRKSELSQLAESKSIIEKVFFTPTSVFSFTLTIDDTQQEVGATFLNQDITVSLPTTMAHAWINTNQVSIEVHHRISEGQDLHILVEKDFPCLDRENEDKSDTFWELSPEQPEIC